MGFIVATPYLLGVGRTLRSPVGTPARAPSSASARADKGVSSAGFITAEQPAAKHGPTFALIVGKLCCMTDN